MPRIQVNAEVQASAGFALWAEGTYALRIREVEMTKASTGKAQLLTTLEPTGEVLEHETGRPIANAGTVREYVTIDPVTTKTGGTISFLRALWEAAGLVWGSEIDTDELVGRELKAAIVVQKDNKGTDRNRIKRFMKA